MLLFVSYIFFIAFNVFLSFLFIYLFIFLPPTLILLLYSCFTPHVLAFLLVRLICEALRVPPGMDSCIPNKFALSVFEKKKEIRKNDSRQNRYFVCAPVVYFVKLGWMKHS